MTDFFAAYYVEASVGGPADWMATELTPLGLTTDAACVDLAGTATATGRWAGRPVRLRCRDVPEQLRVLVVSGIRAGHPIIDEFERVCDNLKPLSAWLSVSTGSADAELADAERLAVPILEGALDDLIGRFPVVYLNRLDAALVEVDGSARGARQTRYGILLLGA